MNENKYSGSISDKELKSLQNQLLNSTRTINISNSNYFKRLEKQLESLKTMEKQKIIRDDLIGTLKERIIILEYENEELTNNFSSIVSKVELLEKENINLYLNIKTLREDLNVSAEKNILQKSNNKIIKEELKACQDELSSLKELNYVDTLKIKNLNEELDLFRSLVDNCNQSNKLLKRDLENCSNVVHDQEYIITKLSDEIVMWKNHYNELQSLLNIFKEKDITKESNLKTELNDLQIELKSTENFNFFLVDFIKKLSFELKLISEKTYTNEISCTESLNQLKLIQPILSFDKINEISYQNNNISITQFQINEIIDSIMNILERNSERDFLLIRNSDYLAEIEKLKVHIWENNSFTHSLDCAIQEIISVLNMTEYCDSCKYIASSDLDSTEKNILNKVSTIKEGFTMLIRKYDETVKKLDKISKVNESNEFKIKSLELDNSAVKNFYDVEMKKLKRNDLEQYNFLNESLSQKITFLEEKCQESQEELKKSQSEVSNDINNIRKSYDDKLKKVSEDSIDIQFCMNEIGSKETDLSVCLKWLLQYSIVSKNKIRELILQKNLVCTYCHKYFKLLEDFRSLFDHLEFDNQNKIIKYGHYSQKTRYSLRVIILIALCSNRNILPYYKWNIPNESELMLRFESSDSFDCCHVVEYIIERLTTEPLCQYEYSFSNLSNNYVNINKFELISRSQLHKLKDYLRTCGSNETYSSLRESIKEYQSIIVKQYNTIDSLEEQIYNLSVSLKSLGNSHLDSSMINKSINGLSDTQTIEKSFEEEDTNYLSFHDEYLDWKSDRQFVRGEEKHVNATVHSHTFKDLNESINSSNSRNTKGTFDSNKSEYSSSAKDYDLSILYQQVQDMTKKLKK